MIKYGTGRRALAGIIVVMVMVTVSGAAAMTEEIPGSSLQQYSGTYGTLFPESGNAWFELNGELFDAQMSGNSGITSNWQPWGVWEPLPPGKNKIVLPQGNLFVAPLAFMREPRLSAMWQRYDNGFQTDSVGVFTFGTDFGLVRWPAKREGDGFQIGLNGAVFALFRFTDDRNELLNTDFVIGMPFTYREFPWSVRFRAYHQSSHHGGGFIHKPLPKHLIRLEDISFEAMEILVSWEQNSVRLFGGGTAMLISRNSFDPMIIQAGADFRSEPVRNKNIRIIGGLYFESWQEASWSPITCVKAGIEFNSSPYNGRSVYILGTFYTGNIPHGQFLFSTEMDIIGVEISLGM